MGKIEDGTAIEDAIRHAVNHLRKPAAVSNIAILLTDGEHNAGHIDPITTAQVARALGVKVYTIDSNLTFS